MLDLFRSVVLTKITEAHAFSPFPLLGQLSVPKDSICSMYAKCQHLCSYIYQILYILHTAGTIVVVWGSFNNYVDKKMWVGIKQQKVHAWYGEQRLGTYYVKGVSSKPSGNRKVAPIFCFQGQRLHKFWLLAYSLISFLKLCKVSAILYKIDITHFIRVPIFWQITK